MQTGFAILENMSKSPAPARNAGTTKTTARKGPTATGGATPIRGARNTGSTGSTGSTGTGRGRNTGTGATTGATPTGRTSRGATPNANASAPKVPRLTRAELRARAEMKAQGIAIPRRSASQLAGANSSGNAPKTGHQTTARASKSGGNSTAMGLKKTRT